LRKAIAYPKGSLDQLEQLSLLKIELDKLLEDPYEKMEMVDFNYWRWLNQKIEKPNSN
jgi:hypothetical protein